MKVSRRKGGEDARQILIGMITDPVVLSVIADKWKKDPSHPHAQGLFNSKWSNTVAEWCVSYYKKYQKPPLKNIESIFRKWAEKTKDSATVDLVDKFLSALNQEYETNGAPKDSDYLLNLAENHFQQAQLKRLADDLEDFTARKDTAKAFEQISNFEQLHLRNDQASIAAEDIEIRKIRWLWKPWLALGEVTMLDGDAGHGKTQLLLDVAARVTQGWKMPPDNRGIKSKKKPANVLFLSAEDSWETTTVPRLMAVKADLKRVFNPITEDKEFISFPTDLDYLEKEIETHKAKFVIVDPIFGFLDEKTDTHNDASSRRLLVRLRKIAERQNCAIVLVRHFTKDKKSGNSLHRGGGSVAWTAFCRLQHVVGEYQGRKVLAVSKLNLAEKPDSLGFFIEGCRVRGRVKTSRISWIGPVEVTANEVTASQAKRGRPSSVDEIAEFIKDTLHEHSGEMSSKELERLVRQEFGIGESTYRKAKTIAGVKSQKGKGFGEKGEFKVIWPD